MSTTTTNISGLPINARRVNKPCRNPETMVRLNRLWEAEGHKPHSYGEIARAVGVSQEAVRIWEAEALRQAKRLLLQLLGDEQAALDELGNMARRGTHPLDGSMGLPPEALPKWGGNRPPKTRNAPAA